MPNVKNNSASQETRRRLLEAAGLVFADRGFHAATIKEITDAARTSLAAVNYHFQDKAGLYNEVIRRIAEEVAEAVPPDELGDGSAEERLRQFVRYFCERAMAKEKRPWQKILLAREMADPTPALEPLHEKVTRPLGRKLSALIAEILGVPNTDRDVGLIAASILGQCIYYLRNWKLIGQLHPQLRDQQEIGALADHIASFSLAGIEAHRQKR